MSAVLALAGGVGGAKLILGLSRLLSPEDLSVVVNTGDDEEFYGLHVSPDLDTVMYTLAGISNLETGWGITGESFRTLERLRAYGADGWFNLGDLDFATHIMRTQMLREGKTLSEVSDTLCSALGVDYAISPMTDGRLRTLVGTEEGEMPFQEYFVKNHCDPKVEYLKFDGADDCHPSPVFQDALVSADAIVFCPSNPFLSVDPILAIPTVRELIKGFMGIRIAVSPIVGGQAIKGPAAKMLEELGHDVSALGVARRYMDLCDFFVIDTKDSDLVADIDHLGMKAYVTDTVMVDENDKIKLAEYILDLCNLERGN
ncbi:2-phospho-L-lactate transferase [Dehalococcoidia bacterium]|nr:2-phospho-L-lactate transferase [Dehalococcoidia bacterium]